VIKIKTIPEVEQAEDSSQNEPVMLKVKMSLTCCHSSTKRSTQVKSMAGHAMKTMTIKSSLL